MEVTFMKGRLILTTVLTLVSCATLAATSLSRHKDYALDGFPASPHQIQVLNLKHSRAAAFARLETMAKERGQETYQGIPVSPHQLHAIKKGSPHEKEI
jgi:hypothetical protein